MQTFNFQSPNLLTQNPLFETGWNSEPQNIEQEISNDEVWNRCAQSFFKYNNDRIPYFDIRYSLFDIRYSLFQSFFFDLTGRSAISGGADPPSRNTRNLKPEHCC